jgi:hypothetical protein
MPDPVQQQVVQYQTGFAPVVAPYAEDLLGQAAALTDISQNPYMQYQGERFAQFSPLQQQAFTGAQGMAAAPQLRDATSMAGTAGLQALGYNQYTPTGFNAASFTDPGMSYRFMTPYMQDVVNIEKREAQRQADIAGAARGQKYARAGAFGGARQAIENAEAQRNLGTQMGDIQSRGLQAAYQQAQQQFNAEQAARQASAQLREQSRQYGAGLGLQGLQTALQSAQQLGNLGQTEFGQNLAINQLQSQYGGQQQQQMQNILNQQYQDFLNYQNYPYKQLSFFSDILRGVPLSQTGSAVYGQPPSMASQIAGLGTAAIGASKLFGGKEGGTPDNFKPIDKPAGLADLAIYNMGR